RRFRIQRVTARIHVGLERIRKQDTPSFHYRRSIARNCASRVAQKQIPACANVTSGRKQRSSGGLASVRRPLTPIDSGDFSDGTHWPQPRNVCLVRPTTPKVTHARLPTQAVRQRRASASCPE